MYFTLYSSVSIVDFEQANAGCVLYNFLLKVFRYFNKDTAAMTCYKILTFQNTTCYLQHTNIKQKTCISSFKS